jgi:hypothetical protein
MNVPWNEALEQLGIFNKDVARGHRGPLTRLEKRQPGMDPPWRGPLKVEIAGSKEKATLLHASDSNALGMRIYTDGSGQHGRISAAVTGSHHSASLVS